MSVSAIVPAVAGGINALGIEQIDPHGNDSTSSAASPNNRSLVDSYAGLVARRPLATTVGVGILMLLLAGMGFLVRDEYPAFDKADKGFSPRGTELNGQMLALFNHLPRAVCDLELSVRSDGQDWATVWYEWWDDDDLGDDAGAQYCPAAYSTRKLDVFVDKDGHHQRRQQSRRRTEAEWGNYDDVWRFFNAWEIAWPGAVRVVFEGEDLLSPQALAGMCEVDDRIRALPVFNEQLCTSWVDSGGEWEWVVADDEIGAGEWVQHDGDDEYAETCTFSRSLGEYIAFEHSVQCSELTEAMVAASMAAIEVCADFYFNGTLELVYDCFSDPGTGACAAVPSACLVGNQRFDMFNALMDHRFMNPLFEGTESHDHLTFARFFINTDWNSDPLVDVHESLEGLLDVNFGGAFLRAYSLGNTKFDLFSQYLLVDGIFAVIGFALVFIMTILHTGSGFVATAAFVEIFSALGVAYTLYMAVFWLPFFPFLNLVGVFIVIGIGADDVFVYVDAWKQSFREIPSAQMDERVAWTIRRAGSAMFVTSVTTSCAFFANAISTITAVRCFGIYCGCVVMCDFFLMVTFLPAVVCYHHSHRRCCGCCATGRQETPLDKVCHVCGCFDVCGVPSDSRKERWAERFFRERFARGITSKSGRCVAILVIGALAGGLASQVPNLELPSTAEFQLFDADHPMERYDLDYKLHFIQDGLEGDGELPVFIAFGIAGVDNGDFMDPDDKGSITYVGGDLDVTSTEAQAFFVDLCRTVKNSSYYIGDDSWPASDEWIDDDSRCFATDILLYMRSSCGDSWGGARPDNSICCGFADGIESFEEAVYETCLKEFTQVMHEGLGHSWPFPGSGVFFSTEPPYTPKVALLYFSTPQEWSQSFDVVDNWYSGGRALIDPLLAAAPSATLQQGFFVSYLGFFNLQQEISAGAYMSALLSISLAASVLALATLDPVLTLLAALAIAASTASVTGILVIDGWALNVTESIIFSVAVGMSIDFVAHIAHAYRQAEQHAGSDSGRQSRVERAVNAVAEMGVSISTAALSTFIAGACMLGATTLFFQQFGTFMVLIMTFSWACAMLFFPAMLALLGPERFHLVELLQRKFHADEGEKKK